MGANQGCVCIDNMELLKSWCKKRFEGMDQQLDDFFSKVTFGMYTACTERDLLMISSAR